MYACLKALPSGSCRIYRLSPFLARSSTRCAFPAAVRHETGVGSGIVRTRHYREYSYTTTLKSDVDIISKELTVAPHPSDPEAWLTLIDRILPHHLRGKAKDGDTTVVKEEASTVNLYNTLRQGSFFSKTDLLSHMGLIEGRWQAVLWVIKSLVEGAQPTEPTLQNLAEQSTAKLFAESSTLDEITSMPVTLDPIPLKRKKATKPLDALTDRLSKQMPHDVYTINNALGGLWRTLGIMILAAADRSSKRYEEIMPFVLEVIAYLHTRNLIPESVYKYVPVRDPLALQPPPLLHLFSSRIMTALSDAAWNAQRASMELATQVSGYPSIFFNPGALHKRPLPGLGPEIWLEFVLWSCLHGGFVLDAVGILRQMQKRSGDDRWSLICWTQMVKSASGLTADWDGSFNWQSLKKVVRGTFLNEAKPHNDPPNIERTISSEVVSACIDSLINGIWVGVGERGIHPTLVLKGVTELRKLLLRGGMALVGTNWDRTIIRLFESQGVLLEQSTSYARHILSLTRSGIGASDSPDEFSKASSSTNTDDDGCSAAVLGFYHRIIMVHAQAQDIEGMARALNRLLRFTYANQMKSLAAFFRRLKHDTDKLEAKSPWSFDSVFTMTEYPGFYPSLPPIVIAAIFTVLAEVKEFEFGQWLLDPQEFDNPIIPHALYGHPTVVPSLIRFATASRDKNLLVKVMELQASSVARGKRMLPASVLLALLETQIKAGEWASADNMLKILQRQHPREWGIYTVILFSRELILLRSKARNQPTEAEKKSISEGTAVFTLLCRGGYGGAKRGTHEILDSVLCIMSCIDSDWADLCFPLRSRIAPQPTNLSTRLFVKVLDAIVDAYGSQQGRRIWDLWCDESVSETELNRRSGGVAKLPRFGNRPRERQGTVLIELEGDRVIEYYGRIKPTVTGLRLLIRKAAEEWEARGRGESDESGIPPMTLEERQEFYEWAAHRLAQVGTSPGHVRLELSALGDEPIPNKASQYETQFADDEAHTSDFIDVAASFDRVDPVDLSSLSEPKDHVKSYTGWD